MRRHEQVRPRGFTLIELLVVIAVIGLLTSMLVPSLSTAKELARNVQCLNNLHNLGIAMGYYHTENNGQFWPVMFQDNNHPIPSYSTRTVYFWGTNERPVDTGLSPFLKGVDRKLANLWCPNMRWGSYMPQGGVSEPTTTYGYNSWCLDPASWHRGSETRNLNEIKNAGSLFVFSDAALYWNPSGASILKNSTTLDPPMIGNRANTTPTTHFRHRGRTNALCADGHSESFGPEGGTMLVPSQNLGFVGTTNYPHYDIK